MSAIGDVLRLKVERAEEHMKDFNARVFRADDPKRAVQTVRFHHDPNRQGIVATPQNVPEPSLKWGIALGDVLHQLRAALDHLLFAIASGRRTLTEDEERRLHFPIYKCALDFEADWRVSQGFLTRLLGSGAFAEVKLTQPYVRQPASPATDPLWILHKLDNIDKHRTILVLDSRWTVEGTAIAKSGVIEYAAPFDVHKQPAKDGAELFSIDWPFPSKPTEVNVKRLSPYVVFAGTDGLCDNLSVFPLARSMAKAVLDVISSFESKGLI